MSFDEVIFGQLVRKWRKLKSTHDSDNQSIAYIDPLKERLAKVGQALLGFQLEITVTTNAERSFIDRLPLPDSISFFNSREENERIYWYRLLFHFAACKLEHYSKLPTPSSLQDRVHEFQASNQTLLFFLNQSFRRFMNDYQFLMEVFDSDKKASCSHLELWPELPAPIRVQYHSSLRPSVSTQSQAASGAAEIKVRTEKNPKLVTANKEEDQPLVHVFEKMLTADNYQGGSKTMDGSDESKDHQEALDELTLNTIIRTGHDTQVYLKSEVEIENATDYDAPSINEPCLHYPEWFSSEARYHQNWCSLRCFTHSSTEKSHTSSPEHRPIVISLKSHLYEFFNQDLWQHRQKEGPEIDIDSVIRWRSLQGGSGVVDQRIYSKRKRLERDIALMILIDASLSTDSWVNNHRVLDELKRIADILSQALKDFSDHISFATFSSQSRHQCEFGWVKQMTEPWLVFRQRMPSIRPTGYTRTGVAIRHATQELLKHPSHRRGLILLTDGKPTDFDRYEGKHGRMDVHMAIEETELQNIQFHSIVLSSHRKDLLTEQFGKGRYQAMQTADQISVACVDQFIRLCGNNR